MAEEMNEIMNPSAVRHDPAFPHAPADWSREAAEGVAREEALDLTDEHWELIRALQEYYHRHEEASRIQLRDLNDALEEHFHARGGRKHLYTLLPAGPVAQGCRLAGLEPPKEAVSKSFGSVA